MNFRSINTINKILLCCCGDARIGCIGLRNLYTTLYFAMVGKEIDSESIIRSSDSAGCYLTIVQVKAKRFPKFEDDNYSDIINGYRVANVELQNERFGKKQMMVLSMNLETYVYTLAMIAY